MLHFKKMYCLFLNLWDMYGPMQADKNAESGSGGLHLIPVNLAG